VAFYKQFWIKATISSYFVFGQMIQFSTWNPVTFW